MSEYDYSKLSGKIVEKYRTRGAFADALGITLESLSKKLSNKADFKQSEIRKSCSLLKIPLRETGAYFFTQRKFNDVEDLKGD